MAALAAVEKKGISEKTRATFPDTSKPRVNPQSSSAQDVLIPVDPEQLVGGSSKISFAKAHHRQSALPPHVQTLARLAELIGFSYAPMSVSPSSAWASAKQPLPPVPKHAQAALAAVPESKAAAPQWSDAVSKPPRACAIAVTPPPPPAPQHLQANALRWRLLVMTRRAGFRNRQRGHLRQGCQVMTVRTGFRNLMARQ